MLITRLFVNKKRVLGVFLRVSADEKLKFPEIKAF